MRKNQNGEGQVTDFKRFFFGMSSDVSSHLISGCVHPVLNVALFMILPCLTVLSQSCPSRAHICGQVITPPTFLSSSSSFAISWSPFYYPSCPPICTYYMSCPSPFSFFDLYHGILYLCLFPDFCVSDFVSYCDVLAFFFPLLSL